jgi:hypothetical protein
MTGFLALLAGAFYRAPTSRWSRHGLSALMAAAVVVTGAYLFDLFGQAAGTNLRLDPHTRTSLHQALALSFCGAYGVVPPDFKYDDAASDAQLLGVASASRNIPYSQSIAGKHGSVERFCAVKFVAFLNNENGLFLLMAALLSLPPDDTPTTMAIKATAFICTLLLAALYMLGALGTGIVPLAFVGLVSCRAVELVQQTHLLSVYSIMPVLLLVSGVGIAIFLHRAARGRMAVFLAAGVACGAAAALIYNFRTSYGLAAAGQLLAAAATLSLRGRSVAYAARLLLPVAAGFIAFQAALIWPLERGSTFNEARHGIWHPLVIGLSVPLTAFSQREGIEWNDRVAYTLAKRINPALDYLGPGYEEALRTYYFHLWRNYPSEMAHIYRLKVNELGGVLEALVDSTFNFPALTRAFAVVIPDGAAWFLYLSVATLLVFLAYPLCPSISLAGMTFAAGLLYVTVEQAAITPVFVIGYQASLIVLAAALLAMLSVLGAAGLAARTRRAGAAFTA